MTRRITFGRYSFEVSRQEKVLFPDGGYTKADMMAYYRDVAEFMLPHLKGRPLTLQRFPDGIYSNGFVQQEVSKHFPDWLARCTAEKEGGYVTHVVCENMASLIYLASQACITIHAWLSRKDRPRNPDRMIFDLDPPDKSFASVTRAALILRDNLNELGLTSFVMTTGSRGLHVTVPLDRSSTFSETRQFARAVAQNLAESYPSDLTVEQRQAKRRGRLYLDVLRNAYAQTAVSPYSVRPKTGAPVAAPLVWKEVESGVVRSGQFNIDNVRDRLSRFGDPWKGIGRHGQSLDKARKKLPDSS